MEKAMGIRIGLMWLKQALVTGCFEHDNNILANLYLVFIKRNLLLSLILFKWRLLKLLWAVDQGMNRQWPT